MSLRPNILYLNSHDTGRYIQPYGHAVPTPTLQKLAEEGVLFRQAYCASPTCSPSRASLLTGQAPHSNGMLGLAHLGFALYDYRQHWLHTFRAAGYETTLIGLQHIASDPQVIGYDRIAPVPNFHASQVAPSVADFLSRKPKEPFYLEVGLEETHRDFFQPGETEDTRYTLPPAPLPDTPEIRQDMAAFKASARNLDNGVKVVLEALEANGLADNTLVISTTDHGIAFPRMKCTLYDTGLGISLIMRGPGGFQGGRVIDALVSQVDLFPTLCELLEIERPAWLQGRSLMPLIREETGEVNPAIFGEITYHVAYDAQRAIRTRQWKYIRRLDDRDRPVLVNTDASPSKEYWLKNGWAAKYIPGEQLYNLAFDPNEGNNLANDPRYSQVRDDLHRRLVAWMEATADPLLQGPVPMPPGGVGLIQNPDDRDVGSKIKSIFDKEQSQK
jgi:arylsulfatase A-like enzyme